MATKKSQTAQANPTWGKTLTKQELLALLDRLDQKRKDREMSKMSDTLKKALHKKRGTNLPELVDAPTAEKKVNKVTAPAPSKKPPTRSAGRGR
jgi:methylmalonyl-CoA mutase N-terminal domain/subunit